MRKYSVELLPAAWDDLDEIFDYIMLDNLRAAERMLQKIMASFRRLEDFPNSGSYPPDQGLREYGFRMVIVKPYISFYRLIDNVIYVYRILHGARNYGKLLASYILKSRLKLYLHRHLQPKRLKDFLLLFCNRI